MLENILSRLTHDPEISIIVNIVLADQPEIILLTAHTTNNVGAFV